MQLKTIISALALSACLSNAADAQQIFKISQYTQHNFLYNPAAAGANDVASVGASYRKMWSGIAGGPQTSILFGDKYFAKKNTGIAIVLFDDKTGPTSRTGGHLDLSYSVHIGNEKRLMFGLGGQVMQYKIDKAAIAASPFFDTGDPLLSAPGSVVKGDAAAGIYLKTPTLNVGVSVQQLIQSKLNFIKGTTASPEGRLYRHYFFMADYNLKTDDQNVLIPNILVKYLPDVPVDVEAGVRLEHNDMIWVGFNYHYEQSFSAFAGVKIDHKLAIGYAYDQYKTPLSAFDNGGGAHEISLRYFFVK